MAYQGLSTIIQSAVSRLSLDRGIGRKVLIPEKIIPSIDARDAAAHTFMFTEDLAITSVNTFFLSTVVPENEIWTPYFIHMVKSTGTFTISDMYFRAPEKDNSTDNVLQIKFYDGTTGVIELVWPGGYLNFNTASDMFNAPWVPIQLEPGWEIGVKCQSHTTTGNLTCRVCVRRENYNKWKEKL